jgi:hypothetical protein
LVSFIKKKISDKNYSEFYKDNFLLELAELENSVNELANIKISSVLNVKKLQKLSPESLLNAILAPVEALKIFTFNYPVNFYYQQIKEGKKISKKPQKKKSYLVVYRQVNQVWRIEMAKKEFTLFRDILSGLSISEALEKNNSLTESEVFNYFGKWISNQLFAKFRVSK